MKYAQHQNRKRRNHHSSRKPSSSLFANCLNKRRLHHVNPSRAEREVGTLLDKLGLFYFYDTHIQNFVGRSGLRHLRFDFIVVRACSNTTTTQAQNRWDIKFIIECQGAFHYQIVPGMNTPKELRKQQINDELKRAYCFGANIHLVEIPFWARPGPLIADAVSLHKRQSDLITEEGTRNVPEHGIAAGRVRGGVGGITEPLGVVLGPVFHAAC